MAMIDLTIAHEDADHQGPGHRFIIDPKDLYPMMFEHLLKIKQSGQGPTQSPLKDYFAQLVTLSDDAFVELPPQPYDNGRNTVLEIARLWFTELLHTAIGGGPMSIHLTPARHEYRLFPTVETLKDEGIQATPFFGVKEDNQTDED